MFIPTVANVLAANNSTQFGFVRWKFIFSYHGNYKQQWIRYRLRILGLGMWSNTDHSSIWTRTRTKTKTMISCDLWSSFHLRGSVTTYTICLLWITKQHLGISECSRNLHSLMSFLFRGSVTTYTTSSSSNDPSIPLHLQC